MPAWTRGREFNASGSRWRCESARLSDSGGHPSARQSRSSLPRAGWHSQGFAEGQIDALATEHRMHGLLQRQHAVIAHARRTAPDDDVAMCQRYAAWALATGRATEQKDSRQAERHGNDGRRKVAFIFV